MPGSVLQSPTPPPSGLANRRAGRRSPSGTRPRQHSAGEMVQPLCGCAARAPGLRVTHGRNARGDPTIGRPAARAYFSTFPAGASPNYKTQVLETVPSMLPGATEICAQFSNLTRPRSRSDSRRSRADARCGYPSCGGRAWVRAGSDESCAPAIGAATRVFRSHRPRLPRLGRQRLHSPGGQVCPSRARGWHVRSDG
jgi:hypothetical protein